MNLATKLQGMSSAELRDLANTQGIRVHHKTKDATIIKAILDKVEHPLPEPKSNIIASKPKETVYLTEDEVRTALSTMPKLQLQFNNEDKTVHVSYNGCEDCLNLGIPLRVIVSRSREVAKGQRRLIGYSSSDFDTLGQTGKNAYTNAVLR